jgi:hypothetical protein
MPNQVPQCTHVKTNGEVCGSPAVSGTELCYHHSAVKTALAKGRPNDKAPSEGFAPIPFVFPEDRASMQINFFLLLQAYNEQRIDQRTYNSMLSLLKAMAKNLGKAGTLVEPGNEAVSNETASEKAVSGNAVSKAAASEQDEEDDPFADLRHLPEREYHAAVSDRAEKMFEAELPAGQRKQPKQAVPADSLAPSRALTGS